MAIVILLRFNTSMYTFFLILFIYYFPIAKPSFGIIQHLLQCQHVKLISVEQKYATYYIKIQGPGCKICLDTLALPYRCKTQKSDHHCRIDDLCRATQYSTAPMSIDTQSLL